LFLFTLHTLKYGDSVGLCNKAHSSCDLLLEEVPVTEVIIEPENIGFAIIPGNADLTVAEVELMQAERRERRLAETLLSVRQQYDYIIIDCPPSLNMLTLNALVAADSVLIPMQCEYYSLEGLLRTMYDNRNRLTKEVSDQLLEYFGDKVYKTYIPRNVRLAEAPSFGVPVYLYDRLPRGAVAYKNLARKIIANEDV